MQHLMILIAFWELKDIDRIVLFILIIRVKSSLKKCLKKLWIHLPWWLIGNALCLKLDKIVLLFWIFKIMNLSVSLLLLWINKLINLIFMCFQIQNIYAFDKMEDTMTVDLSLVISSTLYKKIQNLFVNFILNRIGLTNTLLEKPIITLKYVGSKADTIRTGKYFVLI